MSAPRLSLPADALRGETAAGLVVTATERPGKVAKRAKSAFNLTDATTPLNACYAELVKGIEALPLRRKSLFIASAGAGEGTTTTAVNLAGVLSRTSSSVLLMELRLIAPRLLHLLGDSAGDAASVPGLEELLRGATPASDCIFRVEGSSLSVAAVRSAMSLEEVTHQSGPLNDFLAWAEEQYEWLVLDCPPVGSVEWTRWFDLNADPVFLVARAGVTRKRAWQAAARRLKDRLAGAILIDSTPK